MRGVHGVLMLAALALGAGCAGTSAEAGFEVAGLVFRNETAHTVRDVTLRSPETGGRVSCSYIPPRSECSTTFPVRQYRGAPLEVSWELHGRKLSSGLFVVPPPPGPDAGSPATAVVSLAESGAVGVQLVR